MAKNGRKKQLFLVFTVFLISFGPGLRAQAYPSDYGPRFQQQIEKAFSGLDRASGGRRLKLKGMNDSLEKTSRAARMISNWQVADPVLELIQSAKQDYPQNFFTLFLEGLVFDMRGDSSGADRRFEEFLFQGRTHTDFEKTFISQWDFRALRREVENLLAGRGVSLRGQEQQLQDRVPMQGLDTYRRHPARRDEILNIAFLAVIFGGGVCFLFAAFGGAEFWRPGLRSLFGMYLAVWIAYGIWLLDLAFGLPYGVSRFKVIFIFLGATAGLLVLRELAAWVSEKMRPMEKGYKKCPIAAPSLCFWPWNAFLANAGFKGIIAPLF